MGRWLTPKGQEIAQAERGVGESRQKKLCMQPPQTEEELCVQDSKTCNELDRKRLGNVCEIESIALILAKRKRLH